jgi:hypothetical protein
MALVLVGRIPIVGQTPWSASDPPVGLSLFLVGWPPPVSQACRFELPRAGCSTSTQPQLTALKTLLPDSHP